jgi:hypothetical protein
MLGFVATATIRRRRERVGTSPAPSPLAHGRLAKVAPAARVVVDASSAAERFAVALVDLAMARHLGDLRAQRNARLRADRARAALVQATPSGQEEARRITHALASGGGSALRAVERAHADHREYATRAAVRLCALVREHDIASTGALLLIASAASWSAIAEMLRERAFAAGPAALSVASSRPGDRQGERVSLTLGGLGDLLSLATKAAATARGDLLSGLALEAQARSEDRGRGDVIAPEVHELLAARRRAREEAARMPLDAPSDMEAAEGADDPDDAAEGDVGPTEAGSEPGFRSEGAERPSAAPKPPPLDPAAHGIVGVQYVQTQERLARARAEGEHELAATLTATLARLRARMAAREHA